MRKILVISNMYPSEQDPTFGTFVKIFCDGLEKNGFDLDLAVVRGRSSPIRQLFKYCLAGVKLSRLYLFGKQELVYVHYLLHFSPLLFLLSLIRRRNIVLNAHGCDVNPEPGLHQFLFRFVPRLVKLATAFVVPSEFYKKLTLETFPNLQIPMLVWPSGGIDTDLFSPNESTRSLPTTGKPHLAFISRLDPMKGANILIEAVSILKSKYNVECNTSFVGHGTVSQIRAFNEAVSSFGVSNFCHYLGPMTHEQLAAFLPTSDVMIFPSKYYESLGLVALEAMSCGIPVIGSNRGAIPEYVIENATGHLFTPESPESLAEGIFNLVNRLNANGKNLYKDACRLIALQYSRQRIESEIAEFLRALPTR